MTYRVFRNSLGKVDAVNREDGAAIPFENEADPLTIELREWESEHGALDLSDYPPDPLPLQLPIWDIFRTQMLNDSTYQQIAVGVMAQAQGNWLLTTLQDVISMPQPSMPLFSPLWNQIMAISPIQPTAIAISLWQNYASNNRMGFTFAVNGAIVVNG